MNEVIVKIYLSVKIFVNLIRYFTFKLVVFWIEGEVVKHYSNLGFSMLLVRNK